MELKEIIIRISNKGVWFNPDSFIPIEKTNIPKADMSFSYYGEIYWKVQITSYDSEEKSITLKVKDYRVKDKTGFKAQDPRKEIRWIIFHRFIWKDLSPLLSSYQRIKLGSILEDAQTISKEESVALNEFEGARRQAFVAKDIPASHITPEIWEPTYNTSIPEYEVKETLMVPWESISFQNGYVLLEAHIKSISQNLEIRVNNPHLLEQFENIKSWFVKKLRAKKAEVLLNITMKGSEVKQITATSEQIAQINPELIAGIKYQRTTAIINAERKASAEKMLFTADELFTEVETSDEGGNIFNLSNQELIDMFITKGQIRNKKHIEYLVNEKQSLVYPLQYTLSPNFGFLFIYEGREHNYFIWELLNSHATYVWRHLQSLSVQEQLKRIEMTINVIRVSGRESYKKAYQNKEIDIDLQLKVLDHKGITESDYESFKNWSLRLNSILQ